MTMPTPPTPIVARSMPAGDTAASMTCDLSVPMGHEFTELNGQVTFQSGSSMNDPSRYYVRNNVLRNNDAEAKLFDRLANFFWSQLSAGAKTQPNYDVLTGAVYGTVTVVSSKGPCGSCRNVIDQFMKEFPNVRVVVRWQAGSTTPSQTTAGEGDTYGYSDLTLSGGYYTKVLRSLAGTWDGDDEDGKEKKEK